MLSAAVRRSLTVGVRMELEPPLPISRLATIINVAVVATAVSTLLFLGAVYLLGKFGKKSLAFNWTRVFIAAFSIILVGGYLYPPILILILSGELSSGVGGTADPVMLALIYVVGCGMFWSVPSLIVAAISALIYKFRMYTLKRVLAAGVVILVVGSLTQLYASAFIMHQWNYYEWRYHRYPENVFRLIPNWITSLYYPISTVVMIIGVITIACALLYKPTKTYSLQLKQHM